MNNIDYPVEKHGIRFYNYYFYEVEKPLTIEARSKEEARVIMKSIVPKLSPKYRESKIIGETVTIPLLGISEKFVKGVRYVWVGEDKAQGGWLTEQAYERALNHLKNRK